MRAYPILFKSYTEDGEEIYLAVHHHIFTIAKPVAKILIFFIVPPAALWILVPKLQLIWALWALFGIIKLVFEIISWYFNAILVTNLNLVDVEWNGIFDRSALRIEYNQIESFSYTINGFFNTIFNIGDITIDKISGNRINVPGIYSPKKRTQKLTKMQDELIDAQLHKDHSNLKDILTSVLQKHISEHGITISEE